MLYTAYVKVRYVYKLRPGKKACAHLRDEHSKTRWLWNECLHQHKTGQTSSAAKLDKLLTQARARNTWLKQGSSVVQQQTIRDFARALNQSYKIKGRGKPKPKTKKKHRYVSLNYTQRGFTITPDRRLKLAGGFTIPVVWSRELPSEPTSVRVYEDAVGWWWASFVVEVESEKPLPKTGRGIGIDWGVKTTATTTDPKYNKHYTPTDDYLLEARKSAQRKLSRGMSEKARKRAARAYRTERWRRKEQSRAWAQKVTRDHDVIAVEDFKSGFLFKSRMARKAAEGVIGVHKQELVSWGERYGREVVLVDPRFSTMTCGVCGARAKSRIPLSVRVFECSICGLVDDRDHNAACVILNRAGFVPSDVEDVNRDDLRVVSLSESRIPCL